jgi:hypothetical protein
LLNNGTPAIMYTGWCGCSSSRVTEAVPLAIQHLCLASPRQADSHAMLGSKLQPQQARTTLTTGALALTPYPLPAPATPPAPPAEAETRALTKLCLCTLQACPASLSSAISMLPRRWPCPPTHPTRSCAAGSSSLHQPCLARRRVATMRSGATPPPPSGCQKTRLGLPALRLLGVVMLLLGHTLWQWERSWTAKEQQLSMRPALTLTPGPIGVCCSLSPR